MIRTFHNLTPPPPSPGYQSTAGVLLDAALHRRLCVVRQFDGRVRVVEPYRIFQAKSGRRLLTCYQVAGHTRGTGQNGWKNLYLEDLYAACPLDERFDDRTALRRRVDEANRRLDDADRTKVQQPTLIAA